MIKTFEEQISSDTSWTGGGNYYNDKYLEILDSRINDFALKNKVKITKTEFSSININTQHGSHPNNTTRSIKCIATVHYRNPILGIF